jgi:hypothetical protein
VAIKPQSTVQSCQLSLPPTFPSCPLSLPSLSSWIASFVLILVLPGFSLPQLLILLRIRFVDFNADYVNAIYLQFLLFFYYLNFRPNRLFTLSGTSAGLTETGNWFQNKVGQLFPQPTIFDQVASEGMTWKQYFNDTPWELMLASLAHNPQNVQPVEQVCSVCK